MPLTDTEKENIRKGMEQWTERCLRDDHYPILFLSMHCQDANKWCIDRGGEYSKDQMRDILKLIIKNL
jgi:hypothetical protein